MTAPVTQVAPLRLANLQPPRHRRGRDAFYSLTLDEVGEDVFAAHVSRLTGFKTYVNIDSAPIFLVAGGLISHIRLYTGLDNMTRLSKRIAERLKAARTQAGLSQEALARKADVAGATVSRLERAVAEQPRRAELEKIAKALGMTADDLMGMDDQVSDGDVEGEPTDDELDAELESLTSNPDLLIAFMGTMRDPKRLSRTAKLVILNDLRKLNARRRQD
jgi:transcriptional regulator with XRE-family HTH domain